MIHCRKKQNAKAVQWTGSNVREMDELLKGYGWTSQSSAFPLRKGEYAVIESEYSAPIFMTKEEFEDTYEIVEE